MGESRPPENLGGGGGRPQPARASIWMRRRWPGQRSLRRSGRGHGRGGSCQGRRRTGRRRSPPDRRLATKSRWPRRCWEGEGYQERDDGERNRCALNRFSLGGGTSSVISVCSAFFSSGNLQKRCSAFCEGNWASFLDLVSWSFCVRCCSGLNLQEARSWRVT